MKINDNFLDEFIQACLSSKIFFETVRNHMGYELIPTEAHKFVWKYINNFYDLNEKLPTIGIIAQEFDTEPNKKRKEAIIDTLSRIKKTYVGDLYDQLLMSFQKFVKEQKFKVLYNDVADLYEGGKSEAAIDTLAKESQLINEFSIINKYYDKVFEDFVERQKERESISEDELQDKIPCGIHEIDHITYGGHRRGTVFGALGRSGTGKSTFLRHCAIHAARLGYTVFYFTCEGTRKDTMNSFDAAWTATPLEEMETGGISPERMKKLVKSLNSIQAEGGEIVVHASERFDSLTVEDCYEMLVDYETSTKKVDLVLFDYLEIFEIKGNYGGESGERRRREQIVNKMTNIAMEMNVVVGTATQASDVRPDIYNNPDRVLTRSDISEFKGSVKPISYFYTINQTDDEAEAEVMRLFADKFRFHKAKQVVKLSTGFNVGRFYNAKRTINEFWDTEDKKPK